LVPVTDFHLITDRVEQSAPHPTRDSETCPATPPHGETMTDRGKYVVVRSRQPDAKWKARVDIFNTSMPPQPPAAPASLQKK
jgi:hypothetical protein